MTGLPDLRGYRPAADLYRERIVVVTGAGDGIGRALALALARYGATVGLLGRTAKKLESVYDEIVAAGHPRPALLPLDLVRATAAEYDALQDALRSEFGRVDGLAHLAGILGTRSPVEHYDVPTWCRVLHVNLTAGFILTQSLWPLLRESPDASIVFTSSGLGRQGRAYWGAYAVSKFGVEGLMQVVADEARDTTRIRANSINPGPVRTQMRREAFPAEDRGQLPAPEDVIGAYLFLLGPDGRGINGRALDCQ